MTISERFTTGRRVWLREGSRWLEAYVKAVRNGTVTVDVISSGPIREVAVHHSVLARYLRVVKPRGAA